AVTALLGRGHLGGKPAPRSASSSGRTDTCRLLIGSAAGQRPLLVRVQGASLVRRWGTRTPAVSEASQRRDGSSPAASAGRPAAERESGRPRGYNTDKQQDGSRRC